jgi:3-hydroxybutyryl-CoA dehydrogenase
MTGGRAQARGQGCGAASRRRALATCERFWHHRLAALRRAARRGKLIGGDRIRRILERPRPGGRIVTESRGLVGIVGAGTMGAGIAQVALEAGHEVVLHDVDEDAVGRGRERIRTGLARRAAALQLDADSIDEWVAGRLAGLREAVTLDAVAAGADLVVEAALEDLDLKRTIFSALDREASPNAILATNTSALSVDAIADAVRHPERVIGLHFFNPAPVMALVEVVRGPRSAGAVIATATELMTAWGKTPVVCADAPGFIVNRVNRPFTLEALAILDAGEAAAAAIDSSMREAGYPMGPFELMDLVGIDVNLAAARAIHGAFVARGDPLADRFRPSPTQERLVAEGRLGRKTGEGFYRYDAVAGAPDAASLSAGDRDRIVERIELAIVNEAYRATAEGVAPADVIDLALRLGAGHAEGPVARWAGRGGEAAIRSALERHADRGQRFVPAPGLGR